MHSTRTSPQGRHDNLSALDARCESLERRALFAGIPLYLTETVADAGPVLFIDGTPGDDRISLVSYGDRLVLANKGGWSLDLPNHYVLIEINAAKGHDVLIVDGSVTTPTILRGSNGDDTVMGGSGADRIFGGFGRDRILGNGGDDTIVTIGDSVSDRVSGDAGHDAFWTDSHRSEVITDATAHEVTTGAVHRVGSFYSTTPGTVGGAMSDAQIAASRDLAGQELPDPQYVAPWAMTYADFSGRPLFADTGPAATDVRQGAIGDCYFLAPLAALTKRDPTIVRRTVVDLGDGTFGVRFHLNDAPVYVRVDADLPVWKSNPSGPPVYAGLGAQGSLWVAMIEKAYAFFRRNEGTYGSLSRGWMTEAFDALGFEPESFKPVDTDPAALLQQIKQELDAGSAMTWPTYRPPAGTPLVGDHAYAIDRINLDEQGVPISMTLHNPWAIDGAGNDGANDGYVTLSAAQVAQAIWSIVYARP